MTEHASTVWITGASSGIGLALARLLSRQGHRVLISARHAERLNHIAAQSPAMIPVPFDVTCEQSITSVRTQLQQHTAGLDKVFICAGDCEYLDISAPDWPLIKRLAEVNLIGAVNTVAVALPLLQQRVQQRVQQHIKQRANTDRPQIIGISSLATVVPFSRAEAYGASKAGLNYFLASLRMDLRSQAIDVTTVLPGFVKTPLTDKNTFPMPFIMDADKAAQRIVKGVRSHPRRFIFPKRLYGLLRLLSCVPGIWEKAMSPTPVANKHKHGGLK